MNIMTFFHSNEGSVDRLLRVLVSVVCFLGAFFWVGGMWQVILYVLSAVFLFTAITGFCGLYTVCKVRTDRSTKKPSTFVSGALIVLILITAVAGSYFSNFFTRKFFLDDYTRMNQPYKLALFETGQGNREQAITQFDALQAEYARFQARYSSYRPFSFRQDAQFYSDISRVAHILATADPLVRTGDLAVAHKELESVRPIFQDVLKRNGFSMLAVALVDFHDAMETVLDAADAKDAAGVARAYTEADARLKAVEEIANDQDIRTIRANLEKVLSSANAGQTEELPALGATLKSSFVKVYLVRG